MELCKNLYPCCCNSFCFSLPNGILSLNTIIKVFHAMKIRIICYRGWLNIGYLLEWLFDLLSYSRLWTFLVFQVILIWLSNQYPLVQDCATRNLNVLTFNLQNSNSANLELEKTWQTGITQAKTQNTRGKFGLDTCSNLTVWYSMKLKLGKKWARSRTI